ncbi:MAG: NUDIX domain-containing protein [Chitinophagales bacterium]|nr:NUDIX domain-containing protein [Chitinophagales bacterium]
MANRTLIAAGGLVENELGQILMIFRRGKWDLPKGKLDPQESIDECALREVKEETGLTELIMGRFICTTSHEYYDQWLQQDVIKESHWYHMRASIYAPLIPQTEEDILEIRWVSSKEWPGLLEQSYSTIQQVFREAGLI